MISFPAGLCYTGKKDLRVQRKSCCREAETYRNEEHTQQWHSTNAARHIIIFRDCLNFMNCTVCFCRCSVNTGNTFYDWCEIGSVYGAPADCIWGGGRTGFGDAQPHRVLALMQEYGISAGSPSAIRCSGKSTLQTGNAMPSVRCLKKKTVCRMVSSSIRTCCWTT